jgi:hypothetical protein
MPISGNEIRHNAIKFSCEWAGVKSERAERQTFWREFFEVFGLKRRFFATFEEPVSGANVLHLSPDRIPQFQFAVPPRALMACFAEFASAILEQIDTLENQMENLRRTRDLLLPRLLSGQVNLHES